MAEPATMAQLEASLRGSLAAVPGGPRAVAVEATAATHGLLPEEAAHVSGAVERRRGEFSAGRRAARRALAAVGGPAVALPVGPFGQPLWPAGFGGSITHDGRFAVAVAFPWPGAGVPVAIDLIDRTDFAEFSGVAAAIRHPDDPPEGDDREAARLFAAKEAAIKLLSPALGAYVEFRDLCARRTDTGFAIFRHASGDPIEVRILEPAGTLVALAAASRRG